MTSTDIAIREQRVPATVRLDTEQLKFIANTEFVPKNLRGNLPAILACVVTGREIGIGDMASLRHISIIDGKPTYSAELMVALVHRAGHSLTGGPNAEGTQATAKGRRKDNGDEQDFTFTLEDAQKAGLLNKRNWQQYPKSMLWARAVSQLCRQLFPDVSAGNGFYTAEELGDEDTDEFGAPVIEGEATEVKEPLPPLMDEDVPFSDAPEDGVQAPAKATDAQKKKLDVLVKNDMADKVTTEQLYRVIAETRKWSVDELVNVVKGRKQDGSLSWAKLRDSLSKAEASAFIETLTNWKDSAGGPSDPGRVRTGAESGVEASAAESDSSPADDVDLSAEATAHRVEELRGYAATQDEAKYVAIVGPLAKAEAEVAAGTLSEDAFARWILKQFQQMLAKQAAPA